MSRDHFCSNALYVPVFEKYLEEALMTVYSLLRMQKMNALVLASIP